MIYLIERRKSWPEWRTMTLLAVAAVCFNLVVADRGHAIRALFTDDQTVQAEPANERKFLEHMDFANLEYFEFLVYAVPQRSGTYDYFLNNLQILTEPVPRVWWPGKPKGAPIQPVNLRDYGNPIGFTLSVPGMGWLSLGYIGVVIQCALFALLYGGAYRWLMRSDRQSNFRIMTYVMMLGATVITYRDGTLLTVVRTLPFYLGPIALLWLLVKGFASPRATQMRARAQASLNQQILASRPMVEASHTAEEAPRRLTPAERRRMLAEGL